MLQESPPPAVYGPVHSWRYGWSLGIDLILARSTCSMNCTYCQLGAIQDRTNVRRLFVETSRVIADLDRSDWRKADLIAVSGSGEPTLATNLGETIREARERTARRVLVLTNGTLLGLPEVREDLSAADLVSVKLDAATQETFERVNRSVPGITLAGVLRDISAFRDSFPGEFELQVMIFPPNRKEIEGIARLAAGIAPDRIHLNTPRRPYPETWVLASRGSHGEVPYPARPVARVSTEEAAACARILRETAGVPVVAVYGE